MKLLLMALVLVLIKIVTPRMCRCTGNYCKRDLIDTCYTIHSCFNETNKGRNNSYGCIQSLDSEKWFCNLQNKYYKYSCCTTDLCNSEGLPPKPYLPVPRVKLVNLVQGTVTVNVKHTFDVHAKIDGYVARAYVPGKNGLQKISELKPGTRIFSLDYLAVNTTYVIEVTSYRGRLISDRSVPITIKTESHECDYYKKGVIGGKKTESCKAYGCLGVWSKNGTNLELRERGCWNDVTVPYCEENPQHKIVMCACHKRKCTPSTNLFYH